jgi:hypothetical protein
LKRKEQFRKGMNQHIHSATMSTILDSEYWWSVGIKICRGYEERVEEVNGMEILCTHV